MKVTDYTRRILRGRRERRDMRADGWERVDGMHSALWELDRGGRYDHIITDVKITGDRKGLWIKTREEFTPEERAEQIAAKIGNGNHI